MGIKKGEMMKVYKGRRLGPQETLPSVEVVIIEEAEIIILPNPRTLTHRVRHSPTGFEWGYLGSGPADLALSILWDFLGREPEREDYMRFKEQYVAGWRDKWEITSEEIGNWLEFEAERKISGA